jgi:hypothetical protein
MLVKLELTLLIGQFIARPLKVHVGQRTQPIDVFQNRLSSLIIVFAPTTLLTIDGYPPIAVGEKIQIARLVLRKRQNDLRERLLIGHVTPSKKLQVCLTGTSEPATNLPQEPLKSKTVWFCQQLWRSTESRKLNLLMRVESMTQTYLRRVWRQTPTTAPPYLVVLVVFEKIAKATTIFRSCK